jgi:ankyrin repeat protein
LKTVLEKTDANPNVILPNQGISPLHLAIGNESEDFALEVTRLFLQYGGNPNVRYNCFLSLYIYLFMACLMMLVVPQTIASDGCMANE